MRPNFSDEKKIYQQKEVHWWEEDLLMRTNFSDEKKICQQEEVHWWE